MNIFYLDSDVKKCAQYHCDKHVVKMITEYAQLLSTACRVNGLEVGYKVTHNNHPCAKWVRESQANFLYLVDLQYYLHEEYKQRYGAHKVHKAFTVVEELVLPDLPEIEFTEPPKCVPDDFKYLSTVEAYRAYYLRDKVYFCTWKNTKPYWWNK